MPKAALKPYRLKAGGYTSGSGVTTRFYQSGDPKNNVVMSEHDLATLYPEKFEEHKGEIPESAQGIIIHAGEIPPPGPPESNLPNAAPRTAEEKKARAEELRKQAEALDAEAEKGDDDAETGSEEAAEHVRERFAKSDSNEVFQAQGREKMKKIAAAGVAAKRAEIQAQNRAAAKTAKAAGEDPPEEEEVEVTAVDETGEEVSGDEGEETTQHRRKSKKRGG